MANNAWITSGGDLKKELQMRKLMSDKGKRKELDTMLVEKSIVLQEKTEEFLDNYYFRKETKIRDERDRVVVYTKDGSWREEIHIKTDGSYQYMGGINWF